MKSTVPFLAAWLAFTAPALGAKPESPSWVLAIHGGAGALPDDLPDAELDRIRAALAASLDAGSRVLAAGGTSLDAVQAAVREMESSGLFNAGHSPALNHDGVAELDASLMNGADRRAGAVAAVRRVENPIDLARRVLEQGRHVLLVGEGAEKFAVEQGIALVPPETQVTPRRLKQLREAIDKEQKALRQSAGPPRYLGTVGAVALDTRGNLAAATSTGGLTNKHAGRVGDSPLIGAGTYAENGVCAVSATGIGEYFIRWNAAADTCARIKYRHDEVAVAAAGVIADIKAAGGDGAMIVLDAAGHVATPHSTPMLLNGVKRSDGSVTIAVERGTAPAAAVPRP